MLTKIREYINAPQNKRILGLILVLVILTALPLIVIVSQQQQEIRQRASELVSPVSPPFPISTPTPVSGSYQRVFVTSTTYNGNLGGLTGADAKCQERANAAKLSGTWKAWLSTYKIPASSRLNHSNSPYKLINGAVIADNWDELTRGGGLKNPINVSELGNKVEGWVWTDTNENGTQAELTHPTAFRRAMDCKEWTSSKTNNNTAIGGFGISSYTNYRWTNAGDHNCNLAQALYCFEQPTLNVVPTTVTTKETLTVNWSGIPNPHLGDFMNFMTADGKNGIASHTYWIQNNCTWFTPKTGTPKSSGLCTIDLSKEIFNLTFLGPYNLVLYSGATPGVTTIIAKSNNFTIVSPTPTPTPIGFCNACSSDINKDSKTNTSDLTTVQRCLNQPASGNCANGDINKNGKIDIVDMNCVARNFGKICR